MTDRRPVLALLRSDPGGRRYGGMRLSFDSLRVLGDLGHPIYFVATGDVDPAETVRGVEIDGIRGYVVPFASRTRRVRPALPYQVAKRLPDPGALGSVVDALRGDLAGVPPVLLLEQFPMYAWFRALADAFPRSARVLREHNDEPRYAAMVAVHERGARRAMAVREVKSVARLYHDQRFLDAFDSIVSISAEDDVGRYGFGAPVTVVPAFLSPPDDARHDVTEPTFDFGVFGSLDHGPNADAVGHFLTIVWPEVVRRRSARLLVAGHAPTDTVRGLVARAPSTELLADPERQSTVYAQCTAMVDPSVDGTGVAVKTLEALTFGKPVIGYEAARRGLASDLRTYVRAARSPVDLAAVLADPAALPDSVSPDAVSCAIERDAGLLSDCLDGAGRGA